MDELTAKLSEILNDPESMNKVRAMAENLFSDSDEEEKCQSPTLFDGAGDFSPDDISRFMKIFSRLNSKEKDTRSDLLLALKPHLSEEKQQRVDSAVKILRLLELLPLIKESGLINFF